MLSSYGGMLPSPLETIGGRCRGLTKELKPCKKRACCDGYYCNVHKDLYRYEQPTDCVICSEGLDSDCRPTLCGHVMHKACLDRWLSLRGTCPVCREVLTTQDVSSDVFSSDVFSSIQGFLQELALAVNAR